MVDVRDDEERVRRAVTRIRRGLEVAGVSATLAGCFWSDGDGYGGYEPCEWSPEVHEGTELTPFEASIEDDVTLRAVAAVDGGFVAVGDGGTIARGSLVSPGEVSVRVEQTAFANDLTGVSLDGTVIVSSTGEVRRPNYRMTLPDAPVLTGVRMDSPLGVVIGESGEIHTTADDGVTWTRVEPIDPRHLRAIDRSENHFVVVGDGGALLRSPDGASWEAMDAGVDTNFTGVAWNVTDHWFAVGDGGVLLDSQDSGATWDPIPSPATGRLRLARGGGTLLLGDEGVLYQWGELEAWEAVETGGVLFDGVAIAGGGRFFVGVGESGSIEGFSVRDIISGGELISGCSQPGRPMILEGRRWLPPVLVGPPGQSSGHNTLPELTLPELTLPELTLPELDVATRHALAQAWLDDARGEFASIPSFALFHRHLVALNAPADLRRATLDAIDDERRHAAQCFALAERYAGRTFRVAESNPSGDQDREPSLVAVAVATFREGCIAETLAAFEAEVAASRASDPDVAAVLRGIAHDETRHAALAWRFVEWARETGGREVNDAIRQAWADVEAEADSAVQLQDPVGFDPKQWAAHGRLTATERASLRSRALRDLVAPFVA